MKKTISRILAAMAAIAFTAVAIASCGPEEQPGGGGSGNGGGGNDTPKTVAVTGVSLNKTSMSLVEGNSETLTATVAPSDATNKAVSWKSSDANVANVDSNGKVTAGKAGSATITVTTTDGSKTATCSVTVTAKAIPVSGVSLDASELEIIKGETGQLTAKVSPDDATDKTVTWKSDNENVATVDANGKITAVDTGTANITVTTKDGNKEASCTVTVSPKEIPVENIKVEPATLEIKEGATAQLKATISPADADQEVEWASQDTKIATVDGNGLVTAVKVGSTVIAVRSKVYPDKQGICEVTVTPDDALKGIQFAVTEISLTAGESQVLNLVFTPEYAANKNVSWSSSDPKIATVTEGKVTGVKEGNATITATSEEGGFKAECKVTITQAAGPFLYTVERNILKINGNPDPMNGAFDKGNTFNFDWISDIDYDGKDLYSYETYLIEGKDKAWFCKNREPLIDISSKMKEPGMFFGFSARNGVYALVFVKDYKDIYVIKGKEGDKYVYDYTIKGQARKTYSASIAVAPNGDIHVAAYLEDTFYKKYLAWFKITKDESMSTTLLDESNPGDIDVTSSGDVYIFVPHSLSDHSEGHLYKNGKLDKEIDGIFASSDLIAAQVLQVCRKMGKRVPEDIKLVGFDDVLLSQLTTPPISTIHQPIKEMAEMAVDLVISSSEGKVVPKRTILPVSYIERESTK